MDWKGTDYDLFWALSVERMKMPRKYQPGPKPI
jgi:hypothetical protein